MLENPSITLPPTYLPGWHQADLVAKMRYSKLGETELMVSQVGFGGCVVGGVYPDKGDLQEIYEVKSKINQAKIFSQSSVCGGWTEVGDKLHRHLSFLWRWEVRGGFGAGAEESSQTHLLHCHQSGQILLGLEESL